jgi:acetyltransferase-like isoleucine patch superfamily enzyme
MMQQEERNKGAGASIGDNGFVGAFCGHMPGTSIGWDRVIRSGSVVRRGLRDGGSYAAIPGTIVRSGYPDGAVRVP